MKTAVLIPMRGQGFHRGHIELIKKAVKENNNSLIIIGIVEGAKSSKDVNKNPFNFDERKQYIQSLIDKLNLKDVIIVKMSNGYIPDFAKLLKEKYDIILTKLICGSDRINSYVKQNLEDLGIKVESIERDENDMEDNTKMASGTKVRESLITKNFELFKQLLPDEIDEDTAEDAFTLLRNAMKEKGLSITESTSLVSGITHIEDLDVDDFIYWLKEFYTDNIVAVQKLDGTFNMSVVKNDDIIYCARLSKHQPGKIEADDLPKTPIYNALRNAITVINTTNVYPIFDQYLENGDAIDIEILYGSQPNSICYNLDTNYLALLRFIQGKSGNEAERVLTVITNELKKIKDIQLVPKIYSYDWNTENIIEEQTNEVWRFTQPEILKELDKKYYNASEDLKVLEDWLSLPNEEIPEMNNLQIMSILLTTIPKEDRPKYKSARNNALKKAQEYKLNIKNNMVEKILKNVNFEIGKNTQEGLVLRNKTNNSMTKLVDKEGFTKANKTNWYYMELAGDGIKTDDGFEKGIIAKFFDENANSLGIPMLKLRNKLFKQWKNMSGDFYEAVDTYIDINNIEVNNLEEKIILLKRYAKDCLNQIILLKNEALKDDKLNEFSKKRTSNSLGLVYNSFKKYINNIDEMLSNPEELNLRNYLLKLMFCFSN